METIDIVYYKPTGALVPLSNLHQRSSAMQCNPGAKHVFGTRNKSLLSDPVTQSHAFFLIYLLINWRKLIDRNVPYTGRWLVAENKG